MAKNFTPVDDLVKKLKGQNVSRPKEVEPILEPAEDFEIKEVVEHEIADEEVKKHVQIRHETIKLPEVFKKMGLQSATTTKFPDYKNIKTPLPDDRVVTGLHAPITSSLRWLATLALFILRQAHVTLKTIHGKVVRVITT